MRTCVTIRLPQGPTLARFSAGRLVQTENFAGSLFEAGVEAGGDRSTPSDSCLTMVPIAARRAYARLKI